MPLAASASNAASSRFRPADCATACWRAKGRWTMSTGSSTSTAAPRISKRTHPLPKPCPIPNRSAAPRCCRRPRSGIPIHGRSRGGRARCSPPTSATPFYSRDICDLNTLAAWASNAGWWTPGPSPLNSMPTCSATAPPNSRAGNSTRPSPSPTPHPRPSPMAPWASGYGYGYNPGSVSTSWRG